MTETNPITVTDKQLSNINLTPSVLSSEERKKEFYKELNAIKEKALETQPQVTNEEVQLELPIEQTKEVNDAASLQTDNTNNDSSTDSTLDSSNDTSDVNELDNKTIPKKRLDKELKRRQELEEQLRLERDSRIKTETELNLYTEALKKLNTAQQSTQPDSVDPIDSDAHNFYMKKIQDLENKLDERTKSIAESTQYSRFENTVNAQTAEFTRQHSDFHDAYKYVVDREVESAKLIGVPESQIEGYVMNKLQPIAYQIYNNGGNVAEGVYKLAKNYGYNSKPATKASGVNLQAIDKNSKKSSSMIDDVPATSTNIAQPATSFTKMDRFKDTMMNEDGRGVDPNKFRKVLSQIANATGG